MFALIEKWGLLIKKGEVVIPFKWSGVGDFHEGIAIVVAGFYFYKKKSMGSNK